MLFSSLAFKTAKKNFLKVLLHNFSLLTNSVFYFLKLFFQLKFWPFLQSRTNIVVVSPPCRGEKFPVQRSREPVKVMMNVSIISFPEVNTLGEQKTLTFSWKLHFEGISCHCPVNMYVFFLAQIWTTWWILSSPCGGQIQDSPSRI
jgi:hypothetical protein